MTLSITILCHYAECHYAQCRILCFIYCYSECHYAECRYGECRGALPTNVLTGTNFPACMSGPNTLAICLESL